MLKSQAERACLQQTSQAFTGGESPEWLETGLLSSIGGSGRSQMTPATVLWNTEENLLFVQFELVSTLLVEVSKQSRRENNSPKPLASCSSECQEVRHKAFKLRNEEMRRKAWPWYFEVIFVVNDQCSSCALLGGGKILWKDAEEMLSRIRVTLLDFKLVTWFSFSFLEGVVSIWSPK